MTRSESKTQSDAPAQRQRIAKLMARAGLCSRRDAEGWVLAGRVSLNGAILTSPAVDVSPTDVVLVDGEPLPDAEKTRLFCFHKPRGLVTTDHDPEGRSTVSDYLKANWPAGPRVVTVGRLDINTEGLLLLTNDGGLARVLELPRTGWIRRYRVRAKGSVDPARLDALADGLTIDGISYAGIEAKLDRVQGANAWLTMGLREGKNREIKKVLEHLGLEVNRLIRISFGPFQLLDLPEGAVEEVRTRVLRDQLGPTLAAEAGAAFGLEPAPAPAQRQDDGAGSARRSPRTEKPGSRREAADPRRRSSSPRLSQTAERGRPSRPSEAPTPVRERPKAGTRKHVSTLRSERADASRVGPRIRRERSSTQDRHDRTVQVERLRSTDVAGASRRRLDEQRSDERPARPPRGRAGAREHVGTPSRDDDRRRPARRDAQDGTRAGRTSQRRNASPSAEGKRARIARSGGRLQDDRRDPARGRSDKPRRPAAAKGKSGKASPRSGTAPGKPARADAARKPHRSPPRRRPDGPKRER